MFPMNWLMINLMILFLFYIGVSILYFFSGYRSVKGGEGDYMVYKRVWEW